MFEIYRRMGFGKGWEGRIVEGDVFMNGVGNFGVGVLVLCFGFLFLLFS